MSSSNSREHQPRTNALKILKKGLHDNQILQWTVEAIKKTNASAKATK